MPLGLSHSSLYYHFRGGKEELFSAESDLKELSPDAARRIMDLVYELVLLPIRAAFEEARAAGAIDSCDSGLLAGGVLGLVERLHAAPEGAVGRSRSDMADDLIVIILRGIEYEGKPGGGHAGR